MGIRKTARHLLVGLLMLALSPSTSAQVVCVGGGCAGAAGSLTGLPDGAQGTPTIGWESDPDSGIYHPAAGWGLAITADGTARVGVIGSRVRMLNTQTIGWAAGAITGTSDIEIGRGGATGSLRILAGTTPTGTGCGTGAAYSGNNTLGSVTIGTTPGTCVITFNGTWTSAPRCFLNNKTSAQLARATAIGTTSFTVSGTIAASDVIDWFCVSS